MAFTCTNSRFETDTTKGFPHRKGFPQGSVTPEPLWGEDETLFLEHVIDKKNGNSCYWFMWYDENGNPIINVSAVISEGDILEVINKIAKISIALPK